MLVADPIPFAEKIKLIAKVCRHYVAPQLSQMPPDITSPPLPSQSQDSVFTKPTQPSGGSQGQQQSAALFSPPRHDEPSAQGEQACSQSSSPLKAHHPLNP